MSQQLLLEFDDMEINTKLIEKNPEEVLKSIIAQKTRGYLDPDIFHTVVKTVMNIEDSNIKRLLYYFFECFYKDDKSFIICINFINKDLLSPNEFIRGLVLKFISKIEVYDYALLFINGIKENLVHSNSYVRINAILCISELASRFDLDAEEDILRFMRRENSSEALIIGFNAMHKLGMVFDEFLSINYPKDVLEFLASKVEDEVFLKGLLSSNHNSVRFAASCNLLVSQNIDDNHLNICVDNIIQILDEDPDLKRDFLPYLSYVGSSSIKFLTSINPFEYEFSSAVIDFCFKNANTGDFMNIAEFLYHRYLDSNGVSDKVKIFRNLLIEKMAEFSSTHCVFINEMIPICIKNLELDDPENQICSLNFLAACKYQNSTKTLINIFSNLKYGKILRKVFDILSNDINGDDLNIFLEKLLNDLKADIKPFYLTTGPEIFVGSHLCLCLTKMYFKNTGFKSKIVGIMLKILNYGNESGILDVSSKYTITTCVRAIIDGETRENVDNKPLVKMGYKKVDILAPVDFSLVKFSPKFTKFSWNEQINTKMTTVQLSGLGDPLYVEANILITKYEIVFDMLIINQTSAYLQSIFFDFNFSKNISMVTLPETLSLQANSATTIKIRFSILDSLTSFITATSSFKYPKKNEYSGKLFVQPLNEVVLDIGDFLEEADVCFEEKWKLLEWENIYSITVNRKISDILDGIISIVNGKLCKRLDTDGFTLANIACYTIQKSLVLINFSLNSSINSLVEIRVRAKSEDIVKSVSSTLSTFLKTL